MANILLIEDPQGELATLQQALGSKHSVRAADNGEKAVEMALAERFDLVVTDMQLGEMTGLDVVRRLKRADPYLEAIVVTTHGTVKTAVEAIKEGAYDYVTKPFNLDELQLRVSNALERRDLRTTLSRLQKELQQRNGAGGNYGELSLADLERHHIQRLLDKRSDLVTVAKVLGIGRTTLWRKMREYGLRK